MFKNKLFLIFILKCTICMKNYFLLALRCALNAALAWLKISTRMQLFILSPLSYILCVFLYLFMFLSFSFKNFFSFLSMSSQYTYKNIFLNFF